MSRHVVDVGRKGLLHLSGANHILALPPIRTNSISTTFIRTAVRTQHTATSRPVVGLLGAARIPHRNAAATNTLSRWPGTASPEITSLRFARAFHSHLRTPDRSSKPSIRWLLQRRWNSSKKDPIESAAARGAESKPIASSPKSPEHTTHSTGHSLYDRLPHLHRPTKEELLAAATGFWHRLQIRFKWFSIRSVRPFNHEEIFAFMSWIFWGHFLWLVIGTTTFVSVTILILNTVFAQETIAGTIGNYLTKSSGLKVVFESAVVPDWSDGVISFKNVFVSRRPQKDKRQRAVTKGSSTTAAAAAAVEAQAEKEKHKDGQVVDTAADGEDDGNYSQFDVTIDEVQVSLSFTKWFNGKGLLHNVSVTGVRGVIDRTSVQPRVGNEDPKSYRHEHNTGDFEIDNFRMEDVLLTIYQPNDFRPFQVSVFSCELPRLRKQWLFYDFLCANNIHGSFDNSLFSVHPRQVHGTTGIPLVDGHEEDSSQWKKHSRIRIDGLKIDHLNRGVEGPFSWIYEGNVDIVADVMIPNDADGSIAKVMSDFYDRMEATVTHQVQNGRQAITQQSDNVINNRETALDHPQENSEPQKPEDPNDNRYVVFDIGIHLNDVRASVPIFNKDLSYVSNAAVRPIVAYINSHSHRSSNFIPISCRIVKRLSEFDGSWTVFDSGLLDDLSQETYDAFLRDITDRKQRQRRIKKVGLWAASVAAQALFIGLAGQLA
ncbi:hypothetical protein PRZ48_008199 [Zasmidium cellare]|uniref:Uncharacterized protein n=1 Tax=Zasmidium cellare TaxID=395010 RepID=A0ABR0EFN3_ZASCE|nr:hypothetical protein PRZ48_008199 [Zasmidium cellare]